MAIPVKVNWMTPEASQAFGFRDEIEEAVFFGASVLEAAELRSDTPKTAEIITVDKVDCMVGEAHSSRYFSLTYGKNISPANLVSSTGLYSTHEITHCIRFERYKFNTIFELFASEGLAWYCEELYARERPVTHLNPRKVGIGLIRDADRNFVKMFMRQLEIEAEINGQKNTVQKWSSEAKPFQCQQVATVGLWHVMQRACEGATVPVLMDMPPKQILGIQ